MLRNSTILGLGVALASLTVFSCVKKEPPLLTVQTVNSRTTSSATSTSGTTAGSTGNTTATSSATTSGTTGTATTASTTSASTTSHSTGGSTTSSTGGSTTATTGSVSPPPQNPAPCNPTLDNILTLEGDVNDQMNFTIGMVSPRQYSGVYAIYATDMHKHSVTINFNEQAANNKTFYVSASSACTPTKAAVCISFIYKNQSYTISSSSEVVYFEADPSYPSLVFCGTHFYRAQ